MIQTTHTCFFEFFGKRYAIAINSPVDGGYMAEMKCIDIDETNRPVLFPPSISVYESKYYENRDEDFKRNGPDPFYPRKKGETYMLMYDFDYFVYHGNTVLLKMNSQKLPEVEITQATPN